MKKQEENSHTAIDIPVLFKIGDNFIYAGGIQSVTRFGKGTKLILTNGEELLVKVNYDKVAELVK